MAHDFRSQHHDRNAHRPHKRVPERRRTANRETVQSDELSSTSGARMISRENPYDPSKNPHLSSTSLPAIEAAGVPHPQSPAGKALRREADSSQSSAFASVPSSYQSQPAAPSAAGGYHDPANYTGGIPRITPSHASSDQERTAHRAPVAGTHVDRSHISNDLPVTEEASSDQIVQDLPAQDSQAALPMVEEQAAQTAIPAAAHTPSSYQDYTAASGRYKAKHAAPQGTASFVPIKAGASHSRRRKKTWPRIVAAVAIVVAIGFGGYFAFEQIAYAGPIQATVNGETMTLEGEQRSIEGLLDTNTVSVTPGNYVAVDNSVMREGEGTRCSALINEKEVTDLNTHINEGDQVVVSNGTDVMESYTDSDPVVTPAGYSKAGLYGALHVFLPGQDGETVTRTGSESGKTVEQVTKEKIDDRLVYYNANSNGKKVVALTFDDGPWDTTTDQILDILKENGAKATFYTIGQQVPSHADQIKRMAAEGHEIATHTWDHAEGSGKGVSLDLMSTAERQEEVQKGLDIIKEISGKDASIYFRAPGGNFNESTATDLKSLISGEIGWNIDTEDWRRPGASVIAERIKSVQPGGVVLMHDGGGDRSQTVQGLREAIVYLKNQGYEFVTISELIEEYPYQEGQHS